MPYATDLTVIRFQSYRIADGSVRFAVGFVGATAFITRTLADALAVLDLERAVNPAATLQVVAS